MAPARCAGAVSTEMTRSHSASTAAVSLKSSSSPPICVRRVSAASCAASVAAQIALNADEAWCHRPPGWKGKAAAPNCRTAASDCGRCRAPDCRTRQRRRAAVGFVAAAPTISSNAFRRQINTRLAPAPCAVRFSAPAAMSQAGNAHRTAAAFRRAPPRRQRLQDETTAILAPAAPRARPWRRAQRSTARNGQTGWCRPAPVRHGAGSSCRQAEYSPSHSGRPRLFCGGMPVRRQRHSYSLKPRR